MRNNENNGCIRQTVTDRTPKLNLMAVFHLPQLDARSLKQNEKCTTRLRSIFRGFMKIQSAAAALDPLEFPEHCWWRAHAKVLALRSASTGFSNLLGNARLQHTRHRLLAHWNDDLICFQPPESSVPPHLPRAFPPPTLHLASQIR